jgi:hypothetical protein
MPFTDMILANLGMLTIADDYRSQRNIITRTS